MENNPKKSKALIITIIAIILLVIIGYLIFKNRDSFGVKTSASIAKIFSPLISSKNSTDLDKIDKNSTKALAQAGEDIKKGDSVSISGTSANNNPIVIKSTGGNIFGYANQNITKGDIGEFKIKSGSSNNFFKSFSNFLGGIFKNNPPTIVPINPPNPYQCTKAGVVIDCSIVPPNPPNPYQCTKAGVVIDCSIVPPNPPDPNICSLPRITDTDTGKCIDPSQCILPKIIISDKCENPSIGGDPDLTAGIVSPTSTTINKPTTASSIKIKTKLSSIITNNGGKSTGKSFSAFFSISDNPEFKPIELNTIVPMLEARTANVAEVSYNFESAGVYQIRVCADKKSSSDEGIITESNEGNNCGPWTTFTVTDSLPTTGDITPPPITPPGDITTPPAIEINKCLVIEQNPLTFTPEEKARLAVLLRKFYLVSSTLKTTEDITTIYNEIEQQKNFITQIEDLTRQCYSQVTDNMMLTNGWVRHGNPWYTKTTGGSFPFTNENSGYLKGSIDLNDTERILNIW